MLLSHARDVDRESDLEVGLDDARDRERDDDDERPTAPGRMPLTALLARRTRRAQVPTAVPPPAHRHPGDPSIQLELLCHELDAAVARGADELAVERMLERAGVSLRTADVIALSRRYADGLPITAWWLGVRPDAHAARVLAERIVAHARSHTGPRPLDGRTRDAIERTTGRRLPALDVVVDPSLPGRGRLGETDGSLIRLAPEIAASDDLLGRRVRLHEAAHVAQVGASDRPAGRLVDVERDAHAIADAAARGARHDVGVRAARGAVHGFGASDVAEALGADPMAVLREQFPSLAAIVDGGWDGLLARAGDAVSTRLQPVFATTGLDQLGPTLAPMLASFRADGLVFGALTGCCECLDHALGQMLASFDGFLTSGGGAGIVQAFGRIQAKETAALLDLLELGFDKVRDVLGPIITPIAGIAAQVGSTVWGWVCDHLGLDANLSPLDAIERKLAEQWSAATAAIAPLREAITRLWTKISQQPFVAQLTAFVSDLVKLASAIRTIQTEHAKEPSLWLGILARDLRGTMFQGAVDVLVDAQGSAKGALTSVEEWLRGILDQLGMITAWNAAVPYLQGFATRAKALFAAIEGKITAVKDGFHTVLGRVEDAIAKLYAALKPLLDFVVGLGAATTLGPPGLAMFAAGQVFRAIPPCYQAALTDFLLDLFIHGFEALPATWPPTVLIRSALLGFLHAVRAAPTEQKVGAMTTIARFASGDIELVAGFVAGFFRGIGNSTLGLILLPLTSAPAAFLDLVTSLRDTIATPFEKLYATATWLVELAGSAQPIARPGETPSPDAPAPADPAGDSAASPADPPAAAPAAAPAAEPPASNDDGWFGPMPAFPGLDIDFGAVFAKLFHGTGTTRADLEAFLARANVELAALADTIGGEAAAKVLAALNDHAAPYNVGDTVGAIAGFVTGEAIVAIATAGLGAELEGGLDLAKLGAAIAKRFPELVGLLEKIKAWLRPVIELFERIADEIAKALERVAKWIEEMKLWVEEQIEKAVAWVRKKLGLKPIEPHPHPSHQRDVETDDKIVDRFEMDGENHTLTVTREDDDVEVMMASSPRLLAERIREAKLAIRDFQGNTRDDRLPEVVLNLKEDLDDLYALLAMGPRSNLSGWATNATNALIEIGRKYYARGLESNEIRDALYEMTSRQQLGDTGHQYDRLIHDALVELAARVRSDRDANLLRKPAADASTIQKLSYKLGVTDVAYEAASVENGRPLDNAHGFRFQGHELFVDTEQVSDDGTRANYVFPRRVIVPVLQQREDANNEIRALQAERARTLGEINDAERAVRGDLLRLRRGEANLTDEDRAEIAAAGQEAAQKRAATNQLFDDHIKHVKASVPDPGQAYAYDKYQHWTKETLANLAIAVAETSNEPRDEESATMFVASMIAEARRYPVSDIATLMILGDPSGQNDPIFRELPMTGGGTIKNPPDPTLPSDDPERPHGGVATPAGEVTDQVVELAKTTYQSIEHLRLSDAIARRLAAGETEAAIRLHIGEVLTTSFFNP